MSGLAFPCPHCGDKSFHRHSVTADAPAIAHLAFCASCGENYLSVVHEDAGQGRVETWDYYVEREPALRRVRGYEPQGPFHEPKLAANLFFVGDEIVPEAEWRLALAEQRAVRSEVLGQFEDLPSGVLARRRAWWCRQSSLGALSQERVPVALLMAPPRVTLPWPPAA